MKGWVLKPTSLWGIAIGRPFIWPGCEASNLEEPGAVIPHAGIWVAADKAIV